MPFLFHSHASSTDERTDAYPIRHLFEIEASIHELNARLTSAKPFLRSAALLLPKVLNFGFSTELSPVSEPGEDVVLAFADEVVLDLGLFAVTVEVDSLNSFCFD